MLEKDPTNSKDKRITIPPYELAMFSIDIANQANRVSLTSMDAIDLFQSDSFEKGIHIQSILNRHLSQGDIVTISDDVSGIIVGLAKANAGTQVAITHRYRFGEEKHQQLIFSDGVVSCTFDEVGRSIVEIKNDLEETYLKISSPTSKKRPQDRFTITSGKAIKDRIMLAGSSDSTTTSFIVHEDEYHGLPKARISNPHDDLQSSYLADITRRQKKYGKYVTVYQTFHPDPQPVMVNQQFVTNIEPILYENLSNNQEPWADENLSLQRGKWLIKS